MCWRQAPCCQTLIELTLCCSNSFVFVSSGKILWRDSKIQLSSCWVAQCWSYAAWFWSSHQEQSPLLPWPSFLITWPSTFATSSWTLGVRSTSSPSSSCSASSLLSSWSASLGVSGLVSTADAWYSRWVYFLCSIMSSYSVKFVQYFLLMVSLLISLLAVTLVSMAVDKRNIIGRRKI